jgi:hypothetical protein
MQIYASRGSSTVMSLSTAASSASKVFEEIPTGSAVDTLLKRLQDRSATVGVIGLGYVGLLP